jgi:hypothetical protein
MIPERNLLPQAALAEIIANEKLLAFPTGFARVNYLNQQPTSAKPQERPHCLRQRQYTSAGITLST